MGIYGNNVDHFIATNCEITGQGQEGIQLSENCTNIDLINLEIHDTGTLNPQWAEGIYIGKASGATSNCEYIYIADCEIYRCGYAEAINLKGNSYRVTMDNNNIHDISLGLDGQWNSGAIGYDNAVDDLDVDREIWIQNNTINNVSGGMHASQNLDNGIAVHGLGIRIVNNTISNISNRGIYGNDFYENKGNIWIYNNTITNAGTPIYIAPEIDFDGFDRPWE